jgi:hypothetical protein
MMCAKLSFNLLDERAKIAKLVAPRAKLGCKLSLAHMVRFFMVESIYLGLNIKFNMGIIYL